jgi:hypothetical protein
MSHSQFRCSILNWHMHGLIFKTSICNWQDQPGYYPQNALARCFRLASSAAKLTHLLNSVP